MTLLLGTALSKGLLSLGLNLGSQIPRPLRWLVLLPHTPTSCVLPLKSPFHPTPVYLPRLVICREAPWLLLFNGLVVFNSSVTPMDCGPPGCSLQGILQAKNTRLGCHALLQGMVPTQGSKRHLLHWQVDSLPLSPQGSPAKHRDTTNVSAESREDAW